MCMPWCQLAPRVGNPDERALELLTEKETWSAMSTASLEWARSLTWERTADEMEQIFMREVS